MAYTVERSGYIRPDEYPQTAPYDVARDDAAEEVEATEDGDWSLSLWLDYGDGRI